jgi:hypothetical protein
VEHFRKHEDNLRCIRRVLAAQCRKSIDGGSASPKPVVDDPLEQLEPRILGRHPETPVDGLFDLPKAAGWKERLHQPHMRRDLTRGSHEHLPSQGRSFGKALLRQ